MTKAIAAGIPKMRIEEAAARTQARIDSGKQTIVGVNKFRVDRRGEIEVLKVDNKSRARAARSPSCSGCAASATEKVVQAALDALTETARAGNGNLLELAVAAARAKATRRRDFRCHGEGVRPPPRRDPRHLRRLPAEAGSMNNDVDRGARHVRGVRQGRRAPAAHPGRQDGPGRPRPRAEGDRLRVCRSGLRRRHRPAVCHARRGRAPGGRERRARHRRVLARRRPPDAGAGLDGRRWRRKAAATS